MTVTDIKTKIINLTGREARIALLFLVTPPRASNLKEWKLALEIAETYKLDETKK